MCDWNGRRDMTESVSSSSRMRELHILAYLGFLFLLIPISLAQHPFKEHARYKRQFGDLPSQQIDLNITVPYIFSARLYPYGPTRGDLTVHGDKEAYKLENPFHYLGQVYDTIYIRRDGAIGLSSTPLAPAALPVSDPVIAVFWMPTHGGEVHYRETDDENIVNLAHNEVNIQYRYGSNFRVKSVVVITWERVKTVENSDSEGNVFQLALILGDSMTFAHFVYSKLNSNSNAVAGFNLHDFSYSLPDSATSDAVLLSEKSDIGIPGEWLFRIDKEGVYLCGAGFKGLECIESCSPSQWFNDCTRSCHCDGGDPCDQENGRCPNAKCSPGWEGEPICDQDVDECALEEDVCPGEQPDCLNTPGAFLCLCFEYDEKTKSCKGAPISPSSKIPVEVMPVQPSFGKSKTTVKPAIVRNRFGTTTVTTTTEATTRTTTTRRTTTSTEAPTPAVVVPKSVENKIEAEASATCPQCDAHAICKEGICECLEGWIGDGKSCTDLDECSAGPVCGTHATCTNTIGSYDCSCAEGFRFQNEKCADIDECAEESPCGSALGVACINRDGSFDCQCKDGFAKNHIGACADVDECVASEDSCGKHAKCTNTIGGFECECLDGFERLSSSSSCSDIDECALSLCHASAICSNLVGSFSCHCIEGFVGDGVNCHETILYPITNDSVVVRREKDSLATIDLSSPVTMFGKEYDTVYVSSNGLISFKRSLPGLIEEAELLREPVIFALHAQYDYEREGLVAYTYINESDAAAYSLLMRSSLGIQNQFRMEGFRTRHLHIFTFDRMRQAGSDNLNSFQVVLADADGATMLSLIYETTQTKGPIVGIASPSSYFSLPNDMLSSQSNVNQPGKWMYRVDGKLEECPAGAMNPPLCQKECSIGHWGFGCSSDCHCADGIPCDLAKGICSNGKCAAGWGGSACDQDVDECALGVVTCSKNAICKNTEGAFECHCKQGYRGDGIQCQAVERCESRFGRACSSDATCEDIHGEPECRCTQGFEGNGFLCVPAPLKPVRPADNGIQNPVLNTEPLPPIDNDVKKAVGTNPFLMTNWITDDASSNKKTTHRKTVVQNATTPKGDSVNRNTVEESVADGHEEVDATTILFLIAPAALCGVWLVLVLVVIALFCRKRKQSRSSKLYNGVWRPPTRQQQQQLPAIASSERSERRPSSQSHYGPRIRPYEGY